MELLQKSSGTQMNYVPYRGAAGSSTDVIAGQIDLSINFTPALIGPLRDGSLRGLAVTTLQRSKQLPDIPTVSESGFPGFESVAYYSVVAPAGTPREIVLTLNKLINDYIKATSASSTSTRATCKPPAGRRKTCNGSLPAKLRNGGRSSNRRASRCRLAAPGPDHSGSLWPDSGVYLRALCAYLGADPQWRRLAGFYKKVRGRPSAAIAFLTEKLNRFNALAAQCDPVSGHRHHTIKQGLTDEFHERRAAILCREPAGRDVASGARHQGAVSDPPRLLRRAQLCRPRHRDGPRSQQGAAVLLPEESGQRGRRRRGVPVSAADQRPALRDRAGRRARQGRLEHHAPPRRWTTSTATPSAST